MRKHKHFLFNAPLYLFHSVVHSVIKNIFHWESFGKKIQEKNCDFQIYYHKKQKKTGFFPVFIEISLFWLIHDYNGGAEGIRTLAPVTRSTSLAGKPLEPLEYYSNYQALLHYIVKCSACQFFFAILQQLPALLPLLEFLDYSLDTLSYFHGLEQSLFHYKKTRHLLYW